MTTTRALAPLVALAFALAPLTVHAHSGGTDSSGCHNSSSGRHCHNSGSGSSSDGGSDADVGTVLLVVGGLAVIIGLLVWAGSSSSMSATAMQAPPEPTPAPVDDTWVLDLMPVGDDGAVGVVGGRW